MDYAGLAESAADKMGLYRRDADGWRSCRRTVSAGGSGAAGAVSRVGRREG